MKTKEAIEFTVYCFHCGKGFYVRKNDAYGHLFCSNKCRQIVYSYHYARQPSKKIRRNKTGQAKKEIK